MMKHLVIAVISILLCVAPAAAQTYPNSTTLSAAVTAQDLVMPIASGTNVEAGGALWIDAEFMPIQSCANAACTRVNVSRPQKPISHSSSSVVTVVRAAGRAQSMLTATAAYRVGRCSTSTSASAATALTPNNTNLTYLPIFDVDNGWVYMCRKNGSGGSWVWNRTHAQNINGTAGSEWTAWP